MTAPHPALAVLKAGDVDEAIRMLEQRRDHPSALAMLGIRFVPEAIHLLTVVAPTPPEETAA